MIFYLSYRIKTFDQLRKLFNIKYARIRMPRKGFTNFYDFVLDFFKTNIILIQQFIDYF